MVLQVPLQSIVLEAQNELEVVGLVIRWVELVDGKSCQRIALLLEIKNKLATPARAEPRTDRCARLELSQVHPGRSVAHNQVFNGGVSLIDELNASLRRTPLPDCQFHHHGQDEECSED